MHLKTAFGLALVAMMSVVLVQKAEARPTYNTVFKNTYKEPAQKALIKKAKCNICHYSTQKSKSKKNRNDFGKAMAKALGKDEAGKPIIKLKKKDTKKIEAALAKAVKEKSSVEGKTFGDLIKEGIAPGKAPKEAEDKK